MSLALPVGTYRLDPYHTQIGFTVTHLSLTPIRGLFPDFEGALRVGADLPEVQLSVSIGMSSVQSGHLGRDERLQQADYFDTAAYPTMMFESTAVTAAGESWMIDGDLMIRRITRPIRLAVLMTGRKVFPADKRLHFGFVANGTLSRSAYGVAAEVPTDILSDEIQIHIAAQLIGD